MARVTEPVTTIEAAMAGLPPDFAFFGQRFNSQIRPELAAREGDRLKALKKQQSLTFWGILFFIVASGVSLAMFQHPIGAVLGAAGGFGLYAWGSADINRLAKETKLMLVAPVTSQFGMAYEIAPAGVDISRYLALGVVPRWDRATFEDRLTGTRSQAPFEFFEAHLEERRTETDSRGRTRANWVTVFRGQCLAVKFMKQFSGVTKVYRDMGLLNFFAKLGQLGQGQQVKLEDPVFEKAFEVYSTDQVEARFILTPDFMERLLGLERTFQGKQLRCAFAGGEMYLAVEGKNLLEPGSMNRTMDDLNRVREMLLDFAAIFLLIDAMCQRLTPDALRPGAPIQPV